MHYRGVGFRDWCCSQHRLDAFSVVCVACCLQAQRVPSPSIKKHFAHKRQEDDRCIRHHTHTLSHTHAQTQTQTHTSVYICNIFQPKMTRTHEYIQNIFKPGMSSKLQTPNSVDHRVVDSRDKGYRTSSTGMGSITSPTPEGRRPVIDSPAAFRSRTNGGGWMGGDEGGAL